MFSQKFVDSVSALKSYYSPTNKELDSIVTSFEAANLKREKVYEMFPDRAVIKVTPTVLGFDNLNVKEMLEEWGKQNQGKYDSYQASDTAAAKYLIQNVSKNFDAVPVSIPSSIPSGVERFILQKGKSGKWSVDEKDSVVNIDLKYLQSDFMGELDNY